MTKTSRPTTVAEAKKMLEPKAKNIRSDKIQRTRPRGDRQLLAHTYAAGKVDRGAANSPFVTITRSKRTGLIIETRHRTLRKANEARIDRDGHHTFIRIEDQSDVVLARQAAERKAVEEAAKRARKAAAMTSEELRECEPEDIEFGESTACRDEIPDQAAA